MLLSCYGSRRQAEQAGELFCAFFLALDDARVRSSVFFNIKCDRTVTRLLTRKIWQDVRWPGADDDACEAVPKDSDRSFDANEQHGRKMIGQSSVKKEQIC